LDAGVLGAQQHDEFVVDDLDHLLARLDGLEDLLAEGLGLDGLDEIAGNLEMDVCLQECKSHIPEGVADIGL